MNQVTASLQLPKLDEEDSTYVLRELELNAFSTVVSAMRAQGALTNFHEVVLESLKCLFFIPDDVFKAEIRKAANDEFLSKIASSLNPSYDTFTPWGMVSREAEEDRPFFPPPRLFEANGGTTSSRSLVDQLLCNASSHNDLISEHDAKLANLLQTPKVPFVPERLRKLLRDTENLRSERVLPKEGDRVEAVLFKRVVIKKPPLPPPRVAILAKRKRKMRQNGYKETSFDEETFETPMIHQKPSTSAPMPPPPPPPPLVSPPKPPQETASALLNLLPTKESEALGVKELINKIQAQMEQEQRNGLLEINGRRKRKPRAVAVNPTKEPYYECARARPFKFEPRKPDGTKEPRGNPDRPGKRSVTPAASPVMPSRSTPGPNGASLVLQNPTNPNTKKVSLRPPTAAHPDHSHLLPGHKENTSIHLRQLPSVGSVPVNHVIKSGVPPAVATLTGVIKRPRVASFTTGESSKLPSSPVDLTQRSTALRKATYLQPTTVPPQKVKVAVTPPVEVHGQAVPSVPNNKPVYPHGVAVTVNRAQNRTIAITKDSATPGVQLIPQRPSSHSAASINEIHGHDYTLPKPLIKKTVITTPGSVARIINGTPTIVHKPAASSILPHTAQAIVSQQVVNVVKKIPTTAPVALTATSPAPLLASAHRPSPPPNTGQAYVSGNILATRKFVTSGQTAAPIPLSVGQLLKKVKPSSPQSSSADPNGPPPAKRVFFVDPSNPTVTTIQHAGVPAPSNPPISRDSVIRKEEEPGSSQTPRIYKIAVPSQRPDIQIISASVPKTLAEPAPPPERPPEVIQKSIMEIT